jgi:carbamoyltransferase
MTNIVGIAAHFHDAACCLLREGRLVAAAEEERFSRVKHDSRLPKSAFRFCLARGGIGVQDIDCIAYYDDPVLKLGRQLWMTQQRTAGTDVAARKLDPGRAERDPRDARVSGPDHECRSSSVARGQQLLLLRVRRGCDHDRRCRR